MLLDDIQKEYMWEIFRNRMKKPDDDKVTSESILRQFNKLKRTPSGRKHAEEYQKLKQMVRFNVDQLYELIFSGRVTNTRDLVDLIFFGGHGGSVAKEDNINWIPFLTRIKERLGELPAVIGLHFDWLNRVHHYWENTNEADVTELLNRILFTKGRFDFGQAMERLLIMKANGEITIEEYLNLVDAANTFRENGNFKGCLIYNRAVSDE